MALLRDASPEAIADAAQRLAHGGLIGLPTETVYGLAANVVDDDAVRRIFAAKGRPADHPLIAHIAAPEDGDWARALAPFVTGVPPWALAAARAFWPGPLTLVLPRREGACAVAAGHLPTLAVRCPAHPVAQSLLRAASVLGVPGVAAPSANRFGRVSPTRAQHVLSEFEAHQNDEALLILDGGVCDVGIESTIIDASRDHPVLLRPGMLDLAALEQVMGQAIAPADAAAPKVSGSLASHYAPRARVVLVDTAEWLTLWTQLPERVRAHTAAYAPASVLPTDAAQTRAMPADAAACAHELFAVLRDLDQASIEAIWVARPAPDPAWDGVRDRLQRAAA